MMNICEIIFIVLLKSSPAPQLVMSVLEPLANGFLAGLGEQCYKNSSYKTFKGSQWAFKADCRKCCVEGAIAKITKALEDS